MYNNHDELVAGGNTLSGNRDWLFAHKNGPSTLVDAYRTSLNGLMDRAFAYVKPVQVRIASLSFTTVNILDTIQSNLRLF